MNWLDVVGRAVERAAQSVAPEPTDRSFLERRLTAALVREFEHALPGVFVADRKLAGFDVPHWNPQPGRFDIAGVMAGKPWFVCEVKIDDVDQTLWDVFKVVAATHADSVQGAIVVAAAKSAAWPKVAFGEVYLGPIGSEESWCPDYFFEQHAKAWEALLADGRGRPTRVPEWIVLAPLAIAPVPAFPGYEVRAIAVADQDTEHFIALDDGWPHDPARLGIPDAALTEADIPPVASPESTYHEFALTIDGYRRMGTNSRCADLANETRERWGAEGQLPTSLRDLRCCLFFEQRRAQHSGHGFDERTMAYVRALVEAMRPLVRPSG